MWGWRMKLIMITSEANLLFAPEDVKMLKHIVIYVHCLVPFLENHRGERD